jgi:beta-glucosidase-like glycosyl hydrolase
MRGAATSRRAVLLALATLALSGAASGADAPTLAQLVGQKLVVSMSGTTPSASLLARARHGEIGGVLIHGFNFASAAELRATVRSLQRAAATGGQPKLLIAVDQEGGSVKTIRWIAPTASPPQLGRRGST